MTRAAPLVGPSVVEDRQVEVAEARGVGEDVNFDDLPMRDCEGRNRKRLSTRARGGDSRIRPNETATQRLVTHSDTRSCVGSRADTGQRTCGQHAAMPLEYAHLPGLLVKVY